MMCIRAGPQSQKWLDQQITLNPTGSIHKKARKKKFDPKKVDFDLGVCISKIRSVLKECSKKMRLKYQQNAKWQKITFRGRILVPKVTFWGFWGLVWGGRWS